MKLLIRQHGLAVYFDLCKRSHLSWMMPPEAKADQVYTRILITIYIDLNFNLFVCIKPVCILIEPVFLYCQWALTWSFCPATIIFFKKVFFLKIVSDYVACMSHILQCFDYKYLNVLRRNDQILNFRQILCQTGLPCVVMYIRKFVPRWRGYHLVLTASLLATGSKFVYY